MALRLLRALVAAWTCAALPASAIQMGGQMTVNMPSTTGQLLGSFFVSTGGRPGTVDTGPIGLDAGPCPSTIGPGYVCGRGMASATLDTYLAGTQPTPTQITVLSLKALAELHVHDGDYTIINMDPEAFARLVLRCVSVSTKGAQFRINLGYGASAQVTGGDPRFAAFQGLFYNRPSTCNGAPRCVAESAPGPDCSTISHVVEIKVAPFINVRNLAGVTGWSGDIVLDASHTMEIESIDVLDDAGMPIPDARAWLDDGTGQPAGYFLRSDEVGVVGPIDGTTTTTVPGGGTTTTTAPIVTSTTVPGGGATTTTTLPSGPPCAGLAALDRLVCQCGAAPALPDCARVKLPKSVRPKLAKGCGTVRRAVAAPDGKRARLEARARRTLDKLGAALAAPPKGSFTAACRDALRELFR